MRFHRLEIHNINSLYGKDHVVDFDDELGTAPLFLIMGPTGSGKSTLLDAICLALFGQTPRQRDKNNPRDIARAVMSRNTGVCSARLEFSRLDPEDGRLRYQAEWYCNRAYEKPDGNMQQPRRSLRKWNGDGWDELVSKSSTEKHFIDHFEEARAGMSLDDFLRTILLEQGDFAAFLKANENGKAQILKTLTDTSTYRKIGARAKQRWNDADDEVKRIEKDVERLDLFDDEELETLQEERAQLEVKIEDEGKTLRQLEARQRWCEQLEKLGRHVEKAKETLEKAQKKREERADDATKLQRAKEASPLTPILERCDDLAEKLEDLDAEIDDVQQKIDDGEEQRSEREETFSAAEEAYQAAKEAKKAKNEDLKKARALRSELSSAQKARADAKEDFDDAKKAVDASQEKLKAADEARKKAKEDSKTATEDLDELAAHEGIAEALGALEARTETLADLRTALEILRKERDTLEDDRKKRKSKAEELANDLTKTRDDLDSLRRTFEKTQDVLAKCLGDAEDTKERRRQLTRARDEVKGRLPGLDRIEEKISEYASLMEKLADHDEELKVLDETIDEFRDRQKDLGQELDLAKERRSLLEEKVEIRQLPIQLARERQQLQPDEPCPVCGSPSHPYRHEPPDEEALEERFEEAKKELREAEKLLAGLEKERSELEKRLSATSAKLEERRKSLTTLQAKEEQLQLEIAREAKDLELSWDKEEPRAMNAALDMHKEEWKTEVDELDRRLEELETADEEARKAEKAFRDCQTAIGSLEESLENADDRLQDLRDRIDSLDEEIAAKSADIEEAGQKLSDDFAEVGVTVESGSDSAFADALKTAGSKKTAREKAKKAFEDAQETLRDRKKEVEKLEERLPEQKERMDKAHEKLERYDEAVEALDEKIQGVLDGRDPDDVETELDRRIEEAEKKHETARRQFEEAKKTLETNKTLLAEKTKNFDKLKGERKKSYAELRRGLEEANFATEEELRQASMNAEAFEELEKELEELRIAVTSAESNLEERRKELKEHHESRPEDLDETLEPAERKARIEAMRTELKDLQLSLGAIGQKLETDRKNRSRQTEMLAELKEAKKTLRLWNEMRRLIGAGDGERFEKFAQALNLENIVHHANEHLRNLSERYRLAVVRDETGHPRLDFEIVDGFQADRTRELSTLSGGETFIVSLSLALALADFRQVQMPVETLLLDEGFGTLDQRSLDDAVKALKSLHDRDRRRVGVISHVEQLQERIGHRLVLEKLGGGYSHITVETPG